MVCIEVVMKYQPLIDTSIDYTYVAKSWRDNPRAEQWCLDLDSPGHFSFGGNGIFFSRSEDAVLFTLVWL